MSRYYHPIVVDTHVKKVAGVIYRKAYVKIEINVHDLTYNIKNKVLN